MLTMIGRFMGWLGSLARIVTLLSAYSAAGLCTGAILGYLSQFWPEKLDPKWSFFCGFFLPIGPLYLWFASGWAMQRKLETFRRWHTAGLITDQQQQELRERALHWYTERMFPKPSPSRPNKPPRGQGPRPGR
jgi:hypothetical protein